MNLLFVYGTLKSGFGNNRLLRGAKLLGEACLNNYQMYSLGGFPAITHQENSSVEGEIWQVHDEHLSMCDRLEGHPRWYTRTVEHINGSNVWVYVMQREQLEDYPIVESGIWKQR